MWSPASRKLKYALVMVAVTALASAMWLAPTSLFVVTPGSARDTAEFVAVAGERAEGQGQLLLTTISVQPATVGMAVMTLLDRTATVRKSTEVLPGDMDWDDYLRRTRRMMAESQVASKVAALTYLGYEARMRGTGVRVVELLPDSPAQDILQPGDVVKGINGVPVEFVEDLLERMRDIEPGTDIHVLVDRNGLMLEFIIPTVEHPSLDQAALLVTIETDSFSADVPVDIEMDAGAVSGPSAGLMFALEIINQLRPDLRLTGDRIIAGTGTIDRNGQVGSVGGVAQKVVAAERVGAVIMLVPVENEQEALSMRTGLEIVAVSTLAEAVDYLLGMR